MFAVGSCDEKRIKISNPSAANQAATLLGISMEDLSNAIFPEGPIGTVESSIDRLEGFVIGLYTIVVNIVVALINKAISTTAHSMSSIHLLDSPGFQNPSSCGVQTGASFTDLCHNYMQERLQMFFYQNALIEPRNRYKLELVEIDIEDLTAKAPGSLLALLEAIPQSCGSDADRKGLFWLLHQETMKSKPRKSRFWSNFLDNTVTMSITAI